MFGTVQEKTDGDRSCTISSMGLFSATRTEVGKRGCEAKEMKGQIACLVHCALDQPFLSTTRDTCCCHRRFSFYLKSKQIVFGTYQFRSPSVVLKGC